MCLIFFTANVNARILSEGDKILEQIIDLTINAKRVLRKLLSLLPMELKYEKIQYPYEYTHTDGDTHTYTRTHIFVIFMIISTLYCL